MTEQQTPRTHRPQWADGVPTGWCECGERWGHAEQPTPRTEAGVWLASDGEHVQFHHVCNGDPTVDTLPNSVWPVPADGNVKPSIHCTACGFHEFLTLSPRPALMDAIEGLR